MPHVYSSAMFDSLDGWELVDSMDGRRFLGKISKASELPNGALRVVIEPAVELFPPQKSLQPKVQ